MASAGRSPVSWNALSKASGAASHHTAAGHVLALQDMFVLRALRRYDASVDAAKPGAPHKLHFRDPPFWHAMAADRGRHEASLRRLDSSDARGDLCEQAAAEHLARLSFDASGRSERFDAERSAFYRAGKPGREVDVVFRMDGGLAPVDAKYRAGSDRRDAYGLIDFAKATGRRGGILVTRDELSESRGVSRVPASLFLMLC